jgi:hypothetical protein
VGHRTARSLASASSTLSISSPGCDYNRYLFITNPPWTREIMHPLIAHLLLQHPSWFLFDADWAHTQQANVFMPYCRLIVTAGRIRWLEGSALDRGHSPLDNCAWYLFTREKRQGPTFINGRGEKL